MILNCGIFINSLVFDNSKGMWVTVPIWILRKLKVSDEWISNTSILISLLKCLELVNGGITEGIQMKNEGMRKQHFLSLINLGFIPINSWIGHAFYSERNSHGLMFLTMKTALSIISTSITVVKLIEKLGRT